MKEHKDTFPVEKMAKIMGVSKSGFYKYLHRGPSKKLIRDIYMKSMIREAYEDSEKTYGSPRIYEELCSQGIICGKNKIADLMSEMQIKSIRSKRGKVITTDSNHNYPISPNLLKRDFYVSEQNRVWASDITYIRTRENWLYLCTILDLFSRMIVGWSMSKGLSSDIAIDALEMAYERRKPHAGLIFHSDRGIQYASSAFREKLNTYEMFSSMSKKGDCWDNACSESFFSTLKMERVYHRNYGTHEEARKDIFEYIELFYNVRRRHSTIGNISPVEFEQKYIA